jgi:hypothetical protein
MVYQPLDGLVQKSSCNVHRYAQQAAQLCCTTCVCNELDQTIHDLRMQRDHMLKATDSQHEPFVYVAELVQQCGLQLIGLHEQACVDKAWCTRKQARVEVQGDLTAIGKMLYAMKTSSRMVRCTNATLSRVSSDAYAFVSDIDASIPQLKHEQHVRA